MKKIKAEWHHWLIILALAIWIVWLQAEIADRDTVIYWQRIDLQGWHSRCLGL